MRKLSDRWAVCLALLLVPAAQAAEQVLPPIPALLHAVEANQRQLDKTRESYTFRETQDTWQLDGQGAVKKEERREYNVFYVNGHPIRRLLRKGGAALSSAEEAKETAHTQHNIDLAEHTQPGDPLNSRHQVNIARLLSIQRFTNERRVTMDNRPMIAVDFSGDPKAATHGIPEDASKHLAGTLWIDEHDLQVRRVQAMLDSPMRLEFGLVSLAQGSTFTFDQKLVNNEVWLPTDATVAVEARAAIFLGYHIRVHIADDQYRRFQASAEQQAGAKP